VGSVDTEGTRFDMGHSRDDMVNILGILIVMDMILMFCFLCEVVCGKDY
jgi:hypothetical protein